ncbi:ATP-grasp domain-containing protein, partial [bacterium]|nr:ATP-grasp domain-containing protein [bacterium]
SEIAVYTRLAPTLKNHGIASFLPSEAAVKSRNKDNLYGTCQRLRIRTPKTLVLTHMEQLDEPLAGLNYPLVIKGSLAGANVIHNSDELRVYYFDTLVEWGFPVLLQEKLVGEEYDITCFADEKHKLVSWTVIKKFAISSRGKASAGVVIDEPKLGELSQEIIRRMEWKGPCELEFIKETATGRWFLLEINARFPAWVQHTAEAGCNMPALALRYAIRQPPDTIPIAKPGHLFFRNRFGHVVPHTMMTDLLRDGCWIKDLPVDMTGVLS